MQDTEGLVKWVNSLNKKLLVIYNLSGILNGSFLYNFEAVSKKTEKERTLSCLNKKMSRTKKGRK